MTEGNGKELSTITHELDGKTLLSVVAGGDCAALSPEQKVMYYRARCEAAGLDYRANPFQFIKLQGREVLYATKGCTEQLAAKNGIRVEIVGQVTEAGIRTVTVRAIAKDGRQTDEIGCVSIGNLTGDALCNAHMKCVTKAKRRAVLSICGMGMLDETELETIKEVQNPPPPPLPMPRRASEVAKVVEIEPAKPVEAVKDDGSSTVATIKDVKSTKVGKKVRYGLICMIGDVEVVIGTDSEEKADLARSFVGKEAFVKFHNKDQKGGPTVNELDSIEAAEGVPF